MENRRIAIYLNSRKAITQVQMNHLYSAKIKQIIFKQGVSKVEAARMLLMNSFQADSAEDLQDKILYAAAMHEFKSPRTGSTKSTGLGSKISHVCKKAMKMAIDRGYLL